jgi:hypothetical protein
MPPTRTITYGFGSWVAGFSNSTTFTWWPQDPTTLNPPYDQAKLIQNNLAKNLQAVRNGQIPLNQIEVDDAPVNGGETKVGPSFPGGSMINGCWLEKTKYDAMPPALKPPRIPLGFRCRDYELATVWYWTGAMANRRFWGFYGEITAENGSSGLVSIWPAGTSLDPGQQPAGAWWINFSTQVHPIEAGFTQIGVGASPKQGALFLDAPTRSSLGLSGPKIPKASGENYLRNERK